MEHNHTTKKSEHHTGWYFFSLQARSYLDLTDDMSIGRESATLNFPGDKEISRIHCRISINEFGVSIIDLGSTNGTLINDLPIPVSTTTILQINDKIKIGKQEFIFIDNHQAFDNFSEEDGRDRLGFAEKTVVVPSKKVGL